MNRPRMLVCYICGREYGSRSLSIHQKQCKKLYLQKQRKLPKHLRKPLPKPVQEFKSTKSMTFRDIDKFNEKAFQQYDKKVLMECRFCGRTFKPESLKIHNKSCTADKPARRLQRDGSSSVKVERPKKSEKSPKRVKRKKNREGNPLSKSQPILLRKKSGTKKKKIVKKKGTKKKFSSTYTKGVRKEKFSSSNNNNYNVNRSYTFGMSGKKTGPTMLFCHLCGREFGISSLSIHIPTCKKKYRSFLKQLPYVHLQKKKLPKVPSSPVPKSKKQKRKVQEYNTEAYGIYMEKARITCPGCKRKFATLSFENHVKGCNVGKNKLEEKEKVISPTQRPEMLICYICGREYGTMSLPIHQKQCKKKFVLEQKQLPVHLRKPLPRKLEMKSNSDDNYINFTKMNNNEKRQYNEEAFQKFDKESLVMCEYCGRTFKPDRLMVHNRSCTVDKPAKSISSSFQRKSKSSIQSKPLNSKQKLSRRVFHLEYD